MGFSREKEEKGIDDGDADDGDDGDDDDDDDKQELISSSRENISYCCSGAYYIRNLFYLIIISLISHLKIPVK